MKTAAVILMGPKANNRLGRKVNEYWDQSHFSYGQFLYVTKFIWS